jgi:hypothetical protein
MLYAVGDGLGGDDLQIEDPAFRQRYQAAYAADPLPDLGYARQLRRDDQAVR